MLSCLTTHLMFPHKNYVWNRVGISPRLPNPRRPWQIMELLNSTEAVGMLSGFRITPPEFQGGRRAMQEHNPTVCWVSTANAPRCGNPVR